AAVADARQVRHRGEARLALDAHDQIVGALAGRAAGAVGDGDERRLQPLQADDVREQVLPGRIGLRREELEAEGRGVGGEDVADVHGEYLETIGVWGLL